MNATVPRYRVLGFSSADRAVTVKVNVDPDSVLAGALTSKCVAGPSIAKAFEVAGLTSLVAVSV